MRRKFAISLLVIVLVVSGCGDDDDDDDGVDVPTPTATATPDQKRTPVIFIPGVAGSKLKRGTDPVWANVNKQVFSLDDDHLRVLSLAANGIDADPSIDPSSFVEVDGAIGLEAITVAGWPLKEMHYYDTTLTQFIAAGYIEDETFFTFAFDWRLDIAVEASRLAGEIAMRAGPTGKVNVVAHSMGGLVALKALDDARTANKVDKLVTIATPLLGATKALGVLEYRALCFTEYIPKTDHCVTNQRTVQQSAVNFPGLYQLLPSKAFQTRVGTPLEVGGVAASYDDWTTVVRAHRNASLLALAEAFHSGLHTRPTDTSIKMLRIVGTKKNTPAWIEEFEVEDCLFLGIGCDTKVKRKVKNGMGDGTVPIGSSDVPDGIETHTVKGIGHMAMANDPSVLDTVIAFLSDRPIGSVAALPGTRLRAAPANQADVLDGVSVTVLGTVWGRATDAEGNTTGPLAASDVAADAYYSGIPGSSFERVGDTQQFFFEGDAVYALEFETPVPESDEYRYLAALAGAGENDAQAEDVLLTNVVLVDVERYEDGSVAERQVFHIAATPTGKLHVKLATSSDDMDVAVLSDPGDDGDFEVEPEASDDYAPFEDGGVDTTATAAETPSTQSACILFESPEAGMQYPVGQGFAENGVSVGFESFTWSSGEQFTDGVATVDIEGRAGGSGQDLGLNNINAAFDFGGTANSIGLLAGAYGGNINVIVNGELANIGNLAELGNTQFGGALVTVEPGPEDGLYAIRITGAVRSFSIGGQEFWIDVACAVFE